ncbi:hypothetical protein B296_00049134 [Ensete ventricosum]|uniref:Uncharacterized protein n=1 Tax=Ensete ventricosum TaxID=4639 RepID=A0A426XFS1_ENSVE|nr:hypothetical protein B296_00049134 [Ensete ventricosum]
MINAELVEYGNLTEKIQPTRYNMYHAVPPSSSSTCYREREREKKVWGRRFHGYQSGLSSKNTGQKGNAMRTRKRMRSQIESVSAYCNHFTRVDLLRSTIVDFSFPSENLMDAAALNTHVYSKHLFPQQLIPIMA